MKQVININFQGRVVPIEVTAFELLKNYTQSLSNHFVKEEGKDEIINDIENRIGELFQQRINKGATCITDDDVNAIMNSIGRPEDFEDTLDTGNTDQQKSNANNQTNSNFTTKNKKLYRDENNKILGGVCAGIANYFGIDALLIRILFIISGIGFFVYILLWIFLPNSSETIVGAARKKLYRDGDEKMIAGVASGLANYFGIQVWIPRLIFALPLFSFVFRNHTWNFVNFSHFLSVSFSPGSIIIYIIIWLVVPEANTTAEKLEMKGEKVDINSIKNSVMDEMKTVQQKATKFGKEAGNFAKEKGDMLATDLRNASRNSGKSFGDILTILLKIFGYFLIGCLGFAVLASLVSIGILAFGLFPLKDFMVTNGVQNMYAWGTLIFFIAVPIVGLITWLIRKITKVKTGSKLMRLSFISLWVLGWICFICLTASLSKDFSHSNKNVYEQDVNLNNPTVKSLTVTSKTILENYTRSNFFRLEPFNGMIDDDTAFVKNIDVQIVKSTNDSFRVTLIKIANGRTTAAAQDLANKINFNVVQHDTILQLDKGIAINKTDKFRNQRIVLRIYVPVGKQIKMTDDIGWFRNVHFNIFNNDNGENGFLDTDLEHDWKNNVTYIMKADGLYTLYGKSVKDDNWINNNNDDEEDKDVDIRVNENGIHIQTNKKNNNYRYNNNDSAFNKLDSIQQKIETDKQKLKDSLERVKEKIENQINKLSVTSVNLYDVPLSSIIMPTPKLYNVELIYCKN